MSTCPDNADFFAKICGSTDQPAPNVEDVSRMNRMNTKIRQRSYKIQNWRCRNCRNFLTNWRFEASASEAFSDQTGFIFEGKPFQKFFTDRFFIRWNPPCHEAYVGICSMWSRGATSYQMNCYQIVHLIAPWHLKFYDVQDGTDGVNVGVVGVSWISCVL